jgi:protein-disulfide isomerase
MIKLFKPLALIVTAALGATALIATTPPLKGDWLSKVTLTPEGGHLRGNPAAEAKLIEFVSYTCPHCAQFETESDGVIQLGFIKGGKGSVEVRSFLRNPIDVTASLLVQCGPTSKLFANHTAMLRAQSKWLRNPTQTEITRWSNPDFATRMRNIATDLKLYEVIMPRGYTKLQLEKCLANQVLANRIADQTQNAIDKLGVTGTPSFMLNGELQPFHDWRSLKPKLEALTR